MRWIASTCMHFSQIPVLNDASLRQSVELERRKLTDLTIKEAEGLIVYDAVQVVTGRLRELERELYNLTPKQNINPEER